MQKYKVSSAAEIVLELFLVYGPTVMGKESLHNGVVISETEKQMCMTKRIQTQEIVSEVHINCDLIVN